MGGQCPPIMAILAPMTPHPYKRYVTLDQLHLKKGVVDPTVVLGFQIPDPILDKSFAYIMYPNSSHDHIT